MARITVEDCIDKVENQYDLVLLPKERTSQLNSGSEISVERDNDKNTVVSLREIASGKLKAEELKQSAILRLRKEPDEVVVEEETEEVSSDDFDQLYKGEVSKTGVAILPSKRMRRAPSQTNTSKEEKLDDSPKEDSPPLELTEEVKEEEKK